MLINKQLKQLYTKITNMIKRITITNVDTSTKMYTLQVTSYGSDPKNATMLMPYGLICNPIINSEGLTFSLGGDGSRMYCIPFNPNLIPNIVKGDVALYSSKTTTIILKKDGNININTTKDVNVNCNNLVANATTKAEVTAPLINLTGDVNITGDLIVSGESDLQGTTTIESDDWSSHVHSGVTTGGSNTGGVA